MLALTIFCVVAVALTTALQQTVDTSIILRDESQVRLEIQNLLDETSAKKLKPGKSEVQMGDGRVRYEKRIRAVRQKRRREWSLPSLYEIKVQASWRSSGKDRSDVRRSHCLSTMRKNNCSVQCLRGPGHQSHPERFPRTYGKVAVRTSKKLIAPVTCSWKCSWPFRF